jgi:hypothetical protein
LVLGVDEELAGGLVDLGGDGDLNFGESFIEYGDSSDTNWNDFRGGDGGAAGVGTISELDDAVRF